MNPTEKMSLVAACRNCGEENSTKPIYVWKMMVKEKTDDFFTQDDTPRLRQFAATNTSRDQNLVLMAGALSEGKIVHKNIEYSINIFDRIYFVKLKLVVIFFRTPDFDKIFNKPRN